MPINISVLSKCLLTVRLCTASQQGTAQQIRVDYLHENSQFTRLVGSPILLRAFPLGALKQVWMIADLAQDVDACQGLPVAGKDGIHLLAVEVGFVHVTLILAKLTEEHLQCNSSEFSTDP